MLKPYKNDAYLINDRISAEIAAPLQAGKTDEMINIFNNYRNTKEIELVYLILLDGRTIQPGIEKDATFNQNASAGFIEIHNLAQKTAFNVYNFENELSKN